MTTNDSLKMCATNVLGKIVAHLIGIVRSDFLANFMCGCDSGLTFTLTHTAILSCAVTGYKVCHLNPYARKLAYFAFS